MSQPLPYKEFNWENPEEFTVEKILDLKPDASEGFIFEVDLEYPHHLHDTHQEYPLAPEPLEINEFMLSNQAKYILQGRKYMPSTKFTPNLFSKTISLITATLNFISSKLQKIHKVQKFQQAPWLPL